MNRSYPYLILGFVAWFLGASPTPAVGDVRYTITELPMDYAHAINDQGVVAGAVGSLPARWHSGQLVIAPGGGAQGPWDINNAGVVVGGGSQAYKWVGANRFPLASPGAISSSAQGINESEQIVGWLGNGATSTRGCLWNGDDLTFLGALGGEQSWAYAINESGDIVGQAETDPPTPTGPGPRQAFLYRDGIMTPIVGARSVARDINDMGQVVGKADAGAFLWYDGSWQLLPEPLGNSQHAEALAINNGGLVVGYTYVSGYGRATLWDSEGAHYLMDLIPPDSGWAVLDTATDINSEGQIVGWGTRTQVGAYGAFLLTPIPEPHAIAMVIVGTLFGSPWRRRRL